MGKSKGKILLVEDSNNLRFVLRDYFEILDYEVIDFGESVAAMKTFEEGKYDICLLDIMMPDRDGFSLIQDIKRIDPEVPVVFLTAKANKEDKIKGFKLGCDDYITKPFSTEELALRIEAILRRTQKLPRKVEKTLYEEKIYIFGDFEFNYSAMQLTHPTRTRTLTRKEAELLKLLCEHQNKLLPREVILKEIWGEEDYSIGRSMDVFLTKLRSYINIEKVPDEYLNPEGGRRDKYKPGFEPRVEICNVHGTGFILKVRK
ncbi:MAG: response regulator transcription factor [Bacteroidales bacterium]|jgi:DNA-binding response OmpR family regulator|nr:response regulator transcription factor [Bacteroidales bacterium]